MNPWNAPLHVYAREISAEEQTSLSVLASMVRPGATVLDLGCGSGALGRFLKESGECTLDGVTLNEAEAELARPFYRRVEVADLDNCDLPALFAGQKYDHIICADVLEHLRMPQQTLTACRHLLNLQGEVLISIPNAAYAGLIAELMLGEFTYREEGLLDKTHLRFFTRQSLDLFLRDQGWGLQTLKTIQRPLPESEFSANFDQLPPAVAQYLLALPDALTYQFIATARPGLAAELPRPPDVRTHALFSARLYLGSEDGYAENRKLEATGIIGNLRQTITFQLPSEPAMTKLRLDPADRPGFLHLHAMTLRSAEGRPLWRWAMQDDGMASLENWPHGEILLHGPGLGANGAMLLMHGDDPWIQLPETMPLAEAKGGSFEVELGWPMSADFMALSESVRRLETAHQRQLEEQAAQTVETRVRAEQEGHRLLLAQNRALLAHNRTLATQNDGLGTQIHELGTQILAVVAHREEILAERQQFQGEFEAVDKHRQSLVQHLHAIESSRGYRALQRIARMKTWLKQRLPRAPVAARPITTQEPELVPTPEPVAAPELTPAQMSLPEPAPIPEAESAAATKGLRQPPPVDVIIPVYRGLEETQRCIESVLASEQQIVWRLIVINDCSPEPQITEWLREVAAAEPRILLLENPQNLGFVATVNRGMSLSDSHDVVLLNSDTEVANNWLDRLARAANSAERIGTVTPFSNHATICSYPLFCQPNTLPAYYDTAQLDNLFARANAGETLDVPTGVGFCMYIRRDCLAEVGLFDVENFGLGYGEENDFCQRAALAGWRNLHALDTFVLHVGGTSFGVSKSERELAAIEKLRHMHPDYESQIGAFVAADPARNYRSRVDLARLRESYRPIILSVMHSLGGGTRRHVHELAAQFQTRAVTLSLVPLVNGQVQLGWVDPHENLDLRFDSPGELDDLVALLRSIGVRHIHFHHLLGHHPDVANLPARLHVSYDFTAHDYYTVCPQISLTTGPANTYCGELGEAQCHDCLMHKPAPGGSTIEEWRDQYGRFVSGARHLLVPSLDAGRRYGRYTPLADIRLAPHKDLAPSPRLPAPLPRPMVADHAYLRVLVLGALSQIKGADVLESTAIEAARKKAPLEFHLAGYGYRPLRTQPHASLTIHGAYTEEDLPALLESLRPDVVWFPARWPETYSYTLSACLQAGLPIVAPDLGAFAERLAGRPWTWIKPWDTSPDQWVAFFENIRNQHFRTGLAPAFPKGPGPSGADVLVHDWSYDTEYLQNLPELTKTSEVSPALIAAHLPRKERTADETLPTSSSSGP